MNPLPFQGNITPFSHYVTGEASFIALKQAVDELTSTAPESHDILILGYNLSIREVRYIEPHTFLFSGFDNEGNNAFVVIHFSQLLVHVVHLPKQKEERHIVGFNIENL